MKPPGDDEFTADSDLGIKPMRDKDGKAAE